MHSLDKCKLINFPQIKDSRGNLNIIESTTNCPFDIKRVYFLSDVPDGSYRGGHAHKELYQLIIPAYGSFDILIDDGFKKKEIHLNKPNKGLLICPFIWRELYNFTDNAVCIVLASEKYLEDDYIREYENFKHIVSKHD